MKPATPPNEPARVAGLRASRRSAVPPFIVMDVMQAAAAREARGDKVIHMEVGQPGTPAPRAALDGREARRSSARRSATRWRSGCRRCASASPATTGALRRRRVRRSAWW